jgi:hypothetical protein
METLGKPAQAGQEGERTATEPGPSTRTGQERTTMESDPPAQTRLGYGEAIIEPDVSSTANSPTLLVHVANRNLLDLHSLSRRFPAQRGYVIHPAPVPPGDFPPARNADRTPPKQEEVRHLCGL